jgi:citrate synthase
MIDGKLPADDGERRAFRDEVRGLGHLPDSLLELVPAVAAHAQPLEGLRTTLSYVAHAEGMRPLIDIDHAQRRRDALRLCAVTPTLLCALWRARQGLPIVEPDPEVSWAENYLRMLSGTAPEPRHVAAVERYLISTVDHGFNASTFTARVVASTGADMGASIVAGIGALSGPLHGGAPSRALALLDAIGGPAVLDLVDPVAAVDAVVRPMIESGEKIMGFGHAVYRADDPRSLMLRDVALDLARDGTSPTVELAVLVERRIIELLAELKPGRDLRTNVEFYAGVVMQHCRIPPEMFTPTFASSRVIGWCANVLEQAASNKIIRPSARYIGPPPPQPVPPITS